MLVTLPKVTVAVVVALAVPEDAVMVLFPPKFLQGATGADGSYAGIGAGPTHRSAGTTCAAGKVRALPLLSVPAAVSDVVNPTLTLGFGGSIVIVETVGFTKKPVQLMVRASVARKAKAPAMRSLCFVDDIVISNPSGALSH